MSNLFTFGYPYRGEHKRGDGGPEIEALQKFLQLLGYLNLPEVEGEEASKNIKHALAPDATFGLFDDATSSALAAYQRFFNRPETGELDEATIFLLRQPRCGNPDTQTDLAARLDSAQENPWGKQLLTYTFVNFPPAPEPLYVKTAFGLGFMRWSQVVRVWLRPIRQGQNPDITIEFGTPLCGGLACTFDPPVGDMVFSSSDIWSEKFPTPAGRLDLQAFACHEAGHALGLDHNREDGSSVMFPLIPNGRRRLSDTDIVNIRSLYEPH